MQMRDYSLAEEKKKKFKLKRRIHDYYFVDGKYIIYKDHVYTADLSQLQ